MFQRRLLLPLSLILLSAILSSVTPVASAQGGSTQNTQPPPSPKAPETKPTEGLPTVEQILDKYVQAIGGKAAVQAQTSRVMKGALTAADIDAKIEVYAKAPNKQLTEMASSILGTSRTGFNGAAAWEDEDGEVKELSAFPKREADFYFPLKMRELYPRLELKGKEKIGEREAYHLEAPRNGNPKRWYFDTRTGLLLRTEVRNPEGKLLSREEYEDYRAIDGIQIPLTTRRIEDDETEIIIKFSEVKHNVPIDDAKFEKPAAKSPDEMSSHSSAARLESKPHTKK
jgi:outer membrane lipoprotein-sorting protein